MGTDRTALLVLGAAAALMVALLASTAGGLGPVHVGGSPTQNGQTSTHQSTGGSTQPSAGNDQSASPQAQPRTLPWLPTWSQAVLIGVLAAMVLTLLATVRITLVRPRKLRPDRTRGLNRPNEPEPEDPEEALQSMLSEQLSALRAGTPRNAIVAAWVQLEDFAIGHGLPRDPADTPAEFVARALAAYDLDSRAIQRLADLYREARFSTHELSERHRDEARDCLHQLTDAAVTS